MPGPRFFYLVILSSSSSRNVILTVRETNACEHSVYWINPTSNHTHIRKQDIAGSEAIGVRLRRDFFQFWGILCCFARFWGPSPRSPSRPTLCSVLLLSRMFLLMGRLYLLRPTSLGFASGLPQLTNSVSQHLNSKFLGKSYQTRLWFGSLAQLSTPISVN